MAKQEIRITVKLGELRYEVRNKTYLKSRTAASEGDSAADSDAMMSGDEEDENTLLRCLGNALSRVKHLLGEHMSEGELRGNNLQQPDSDSLSLRLLMPTNYDTNATADLAAALHRFIVDHVLSVWFADTDPKAADQYAKNAAADQEAMYDASMRRARPKRRTRPGSPSDGGGGTTETDDLLWHDALVWEDDSVWIEVARA